MNIRKDLKELLAQQVITAEVADRIQAYYDQKSSSGPNRIVTAFGILGALLAGLGVILIIAHNWDDLSKTTKTTLAFAPMVIGQALCLFSILRKTGSTVWKESSATFLFFAIGACISLISQIYHIHGDIGGYLLVWMLLSLPVVYVLQSSMVSLLFLVGITYYGAHVGYWKGSGNFPYYYWLMLLAAIPHYLWLYKTKHDSNFIFFHNWVVPLSIISILGSTAHNEPEWMFVTYMSLFGLLYQIGQLSFFKDQPKRNNGYWLIGSLGTIITLLVLSFSWFWDTLIDKTFVTAILVSPEFISTVVLGGAAGFFLFKNADKTSLPGIGFILFPIIFMIGYTTTLAVLLINLLVFAIGIQLIFQGQKHYHIGLLNYGLLTITALIICRFFDANLTFIVRGILFLAIGASFFLANYWIINKRPNHE